MTMTHDNFWEGETGATETAHDAVLLRATGGQRFIKRTLQRLLGASLSVAAVGLWLLPIGDGSTTEVLCKLMVSIVLGFTGAAFWQAGSPRPRPELEIDIARREMRLVRYQGETKTLVTRRRFRDLSRFKFDGCDVQLWDNDGDLLAELTLPDMASADALHLALEDSRPYLLRNAA